jgi:DNA-binding NtrC family response regulator
MGHERILILDDEPDIAASWVRILGSGGYRCLSTSEPEEALRLLESERFDLLLTDLRMPGMDGMEMLKRAQKIDPQMPVVMLTGYASLEFAVAAVKAGAFDFLSKSFSNDELRLTVQRASPERSWITIISRPPFDVDPHRPAARLCATRPHQAPIGNRESSFA